MPGRQEIAPKSEPISSVKVLAIMCSNGRSAKLGRLGTVHGVLLCGGVSGVDRGHWGAKTIHQPPLIKRIYIYNII